MCPNLIKNIVLRKNRGLSQEKLAELTGFHRTYIGMIERGERNPALINIAIFAKTFGMSLSELLDLESVKFSDNSHD